MLAKQFRIGQRHAWLVHQLATKRGLTDSALLRVLIDEEAKRTGVEEPLVIVTAVRGAVLCPKCNRLGTLCLSVSQAQPGERWQVRHGAVVYQDENGTCELTIPEATKLLRSVS